ncbi:MAG: glycosyltransferase family 4 protein [Candidatus Firestonebacteria bacterium]
MKICYLGAGNSVHIKRWCEYFSSRGYEVSLITLHPVTELKNVKIYQIKSRLNRYMDIAFFLNRRKILSILNEIKPDILHGHYLINYGFYSAALKYRPLVLSTWGSDVLVAPVESIRHRLMLKYAVSNADVITVESQYIKNILKDKYKVSENKLAIFSWGTDCNVFSIRYTEEVEKLRNKLGIQNGQTVILSPRSLFPIYNIYTIVQSISDVLQQNPDTVFVFLRGSCNLDYEKKIQNLVAKLNIERNCKFIEDFLSPCEMAVLYNLSDIFISIPFSDSVSISLLEGMACGTIPLVNSLPVNCELIKDEINGLIIPNTAKDELAKKINYAIKNKNTFKTRFADYNQKYILEEHNWHKNAVKMEEIYKKLVI